MSNKKLELAEGGQIIRDENAMYLKSKINAQSGRLVLTDRRLVFLKNRANMFGLIGALFLSKGGKVLFDIPLDEVHEWSQSKHGRNDKVIALSTGDGSQLRFITAKPYQEWDGALSAATPRS